jgi:hypothetical protein
MSGLGSGMYFDRQGRPMEMLDWVRKHADLDYKVVAQHWIRGWMVSTVWLGINHRFTGDGPPVIFETMIFPPGDEMGDGTVWSEQYMDRYSTEAAAQAGHDQAISALRERLGDDAMADIAGPIVDGSSDSEWDGSIEGDR